MHTSTTSTADDNVFFHVHHVDDLRDAHSGWDDLSAKEKLRLTRTVPSVEEASFHNVTCTGLHETIVDNLNNEATSKIEATHLALGDGATAPSTSNTSLNNEVARVTVTDSVDNGTTLKCSTFVDSTEANGFTLEEVGLVTASSGGQLLNHSLITSTAKDSTKTVTVDVDLTFQDV